MFSGQHPRAGNGWKWATPGKALNIFEQLLLVWPQSNAKKSWCDLTPWSQKAIATNPIASWLPHTSYRLLRIAVIDVKFASTFPPWHIHSWFETKSYQLWRHPRALSIIVKKGWKGDIARNRMNVPTSSKTLLNVIVLSTWGPSQAFPKGMDETYRFSLDQMSQRCKISIKFVRQNPLPFSQPARLLWKWGYTTSIIDGTMLFLENGWHDAWSLNQKIQETVDGMTWILGKLQEILQSKKM